MTFLGRILGVISIGLLYLAPLPAQAEGSPVVVTIAGKIENSNRGPLDEFADAFTKFRDKSFESAFELTLEDLAGYEQKTVTAKAENWPAELTLSGPRLSDVLAAAGASKRSVAFMALDGYEIVLTAAQLAEKEWILATSANGSPLAIGGRGPTWIVHDTEGKAVSQDVEANWVWSVFFIEARQD